MAEDSHARNAPKPRPGRPLRPEEIPWRQRTPVLLIWATTILVGMIALVAPLPFTGQVVLEVGDVAPTDIVAPRQVTYISEILTEQRRELAANAVPEFYDPPQARVGRQQLTKASRILEFIGSVRSDTYSDPTAKMAYVKAIADLDLPADVVTRILTLPAPAWDRVAAEIQVVLDRAMREEIRENQLADERRKVAARVRLDLSDEDATIVSQVVQDLLIPNSFYNAERTEERRQEARDLVEPVAATVERNEAILRPGDIVTALDVEALDNIGLRQAAWTWPNLRSAAAIMLLLGVAFVYYLWYQEPDLWFDYVSHLLIAASFLVFLVVAKAIVPAHAVLSYMFPYAAFAMLIAVLVNVRVALISGVFFVLLVGWLSGGSLELMAFAFFGSLVGVLRLRRGERLSSFAWVALYLVVTNLLVVAAFRLSAGKIDARGIAELALAGSANGLVTVAVTLLGAYLAGALFGIATPLLLMEISRPTHPLLRQLLLKAPGTYHHTLIVSNMAERAAEAIGGDMQLARVGAYYHDVGKAIRPYFFVENQMEGATPHTRLDPYTSAQIIISHVKDGIDLARKYHLPRRVIEFIPEHQGTLLVSFFYHEAVKQAGSPDKVDKSQFAYPGPKPRSRETAITMLADGAEATVRAKHPATAEELNQIIAESIKSRIEDGQLDECELTLGDLQLIRQAFADVLRGIHHPRVTYPTAPVSEAAGITVSEEEADVPSSVTQGA